MRTFRDELTQQLQVRVAAPSYDYADGMQPETYIGPVKRQIAYWRERKEAGAELTAHEESPTALAVEGSRVAPTRTYRIEGWRKRVYEFCDQVRPLVAIERSVRTTHSQAEIVPIVAGHEFRGDHLIQERLNLHRRGLARTGGIAPHEPAGSRRNGSCGRHVAYLGTPNSDKRANRRIWSRRAKVHFFLVDRVRSFAVRMVDLATASGELGRRVSHDEPAPLLPALTTATALP